MNLNELSKEIHANAVEKGFWEGERNFGEQIALMHSELSEALEEYRDGKPNIYYKANCGCMSGIGEKPEGIAIEFADTIIRILDTCAAMKIDIEWAIKLKMTYNKSREYKHGKR